MSHNKIVNKTFDIEADILLNKLVEIPRIDEKSSGKSELIINDDPKSEILKAFRTLKTNVQFLNVNNKTNKAILVTSPYKQEGKSYVTANLAIAYSEIGKKVLIIDADLKQGRQSSIFNIPNRLGFSNLLSGLDNDGLEMDTAVNNFINETSIKNVSVITSGTIPPNSVELLSSKKIPDIIKEISDIYDIIIIDGTSILLSEDSLLLSRRVGSTIIITDYNMTKKEELIESKKDIQNVGGRIIGVVCNKVGNVPNKNKSLLKSVGLKINVFFKNIFTKIKNNIKNRKPKLLEEGKENINKVEINPKKENINNGIKKENKIKKNNIKIVEKNENKDNKIPLNNADLNLKLQKGKNEGNTNESTIKTNINTNNEDIKPAIVLKTSKNKIKEKNDLNKKEEKKFIIKDETEKEKIFIKNEEQVKPEEQNFIDNIDNIDNNVDMDKKGVLLIVDSLNGICRVFNKDCYTEKLVRGLDKSDGFVKAHYSIYFMSKIIEGLMPLYNLTKKQAKIIDPLVYDTLCDFDECIWLEKKIDSDLAGIYVKCMTVDVKKLPTEGFNKYNNRCKKLRNEFLKKSNLEIEYHLNYSGKANNIKFIDKIMMKKFSNYLNYKDVEETVDNKVREKTKQEESVEHKLEGKKDLLVNNKQKEYDERQEEKKRKKELQNEKKKETEILRKIKKEKQNVKRRELHSKKEIEKEERSKAREEIKRKRKHERERLKEEARIEEELLEDNLYPKTKNNKDLL